MQILILEIFVHRIDAETAFFIWENEERTDKGKNSVVTLFYQWHCIYGRAQIRGNAEPRPEIWLPSILDHWF